MASLALVCDLRCIPLFFSLEPRTRVRVRVAMPAREIANRSTKKDGTLCSYPNRQVIFALQPKTVKMKLNMLKAC